MNLASRVKGFHACIDHILKQDQDGASPKKKKEGTEQGNQRENRLLLGGRSMGSRAAVIAATEYLSAPSNLSLPNSSESSIDLILVSYPLINGNKPMRDQILLDLPTHVRVLFITGSEDKMCPLEQLTTVRESMRAQSWMIVVEGLDHGMRGKRERELGEWAGRAAAEWVAGETRGYPRVLRVLRAGDLKGDEVQG
jgi:predicted alpha/beta-hydrolase family hydrolase